MKTYFGDVAPRILDLSTRWIWSASRPSHFTPREGAPVTHWIGGWVSHRAGLDTVVRRKLPRPYRYPVQEHMIFLLCIS
jgi:hypothetical protein